MTQEEKAKRYDEALERAKKYKLKEDLIITQDLFPELKESEDEKTKRILYSISSKMSFHLSDIFTEEEFQCFDAWSNAWLEKQGEQKSQRIVSAEAKEAMYDKPAWSEEEENRFNRLIAYFEDKESFTAEDDVVYANWLKSIKDRVQPKQEWSEEDEKKRNLLISILNVNHPNDYFKVNPANTLNMEAIHTEELIDWLKSLRPQKHWSEEKLREGLNEAANEWDSKASFSPFYMVMDGDRPTDVKQDITSHGDSFKAGVDWIIKKLKG